ncbi:MAG: phosphoribosyltransferase [Candidatus Zambryskibacteria bacterium]|nr:phosphoribosyltransferase [Candidatus Zambryskibacteria bacterium]
MRKFKNRKEAGKLLAQKLLGYKEEKPLILALPRGGVPVAYEVVQALEAPLDTLVARKIGSPSNPEFGVGAVAPNDVLILGKDINREELGPVIKQEKDEMKRRILRYRSGEFAKNIPAKTVIIVDDGLATGVTARAAIESALLQYKPLKLIFAAPVCAKDTAEALRNLVDVVCLNEADNFVAVGEWYEDFPQTTDREVVELLEKAKAELT